jgi:hypothetical protein
MAITTLANLQIVPNKFSAYVLQRTTDKLTLVRRGIASGNPVLAQLINGTPKGGRFIEMPFIKPLTGEDYIFGEGDENDKEATGIETGNGTATLLMRWHMWGDSDLSHVLGGIDPMAAVGNLVGDWWAQKEQAIYLSVLKGILDPTAGALKAHVNDVSAASGEAAHISVGNTLDTKQALGDAANILGMVFMHSAVYTHLQKNQQIVTEYDATLQINIQTYLGYQVVVDDGMPVTGEGVDRVFDTYFLGTGAFSREDGMPQGYVGTETDRDKVLANNYLINRRCMVIHPNGFSWKLPAGKYTNSQMLFPNNADLADPTNWSLIADHKTVPIACLRHKIG